MWRQFTHASRLRQRAANQAGETGGAGGLVGVGGPPREPERKTSGSTFLRPRVIVPLVLGVGLLVALVLVANPAEAVRLITHFDVRDLLAFFALMAGYEVVRFAQWSYLLRQLDLRVPVRTQIFSYAIGEFAKNLPIGNFIPDYILTREEGVDFGRASSSSLLVAVIEVAVALVGIAVIGIEGWMWLRPLIIGGSLLFMVGVWVFAHSQEEAGEASGTDGAGVGIEGVGNASSSSSRGRVRGRARGLLRRRWVREALREVRQFTQGEARLLRPRVIVVSALAAAVYLVLSGLALFVVLRGLGLTGVTWQEALAASFFSLAVSMIIPLPTDLGSSEASGAGALVAFGLGTTGAVSALLLYRFLNLAAQVFIALLASIILPGQFRALWQARPRRSRSGTRSAHAAGKRVGHGE